jgi:hypothetical protein
VPFSLVSASFLAAGNGGPPRRSSSPAGSSLSPSIFYFALFVLDRTTVNASYPFGGDLLKEPLGFLVIEPAVLGRLQIPNLIYYKS